MTDEIAPGQQPKLKPEPKYSPDVFTHELECSHCGTLHKAVELTIPADQKHLDWKPCCVKCGKENQLRFHRVKQLPKEALEDEQR